jgi:hypothetical protein
MNTKLAVVLVSTVAVVLCAPLAVQAAPACCAVGAKADVNPVAGMLTRTQIQEGWICLFDGQTRFGWKIQGDAKVEGGKLILGGGSPTEAETTTRFGAYELRIEAEGLRYAQVVLSGEVQKPVSVDGRAGALVGKVAAAAEPLPVIIRVPAGKTLSVSKVLLRPLGTEPIFNGKDLTGWTPVADKKSIFSVVDGTINVKDGGGDLQSEWQGDDFVLQIDAISNGKHLNSGIFYRALPGQYWQGYEVQIRNQWEGDDRTKPVDYGTGGIYNRQPTRMVVPSDGEWFTMTLVARGAHMATWVNGYQCTDYVDKQDDAPTARKGRYLGKGCITIQGHDPTTDLNFKNIRVADLPKKGETR